MTERSPLFFLLASHLFLSGVLSSSILRIENNCKNTIWPVLCSWRSEVSTTGFALKSGEILDINAPSSWDGLISARTLCSYDSAGNFTCVTGDCGSKVIECNLTYGWSPVTYVYFKIDDFGVNTYKINLKYGYNLPVKVTPSMSASGTPCMSSGCMVDLNKTCPDNLKKISEGNLDACSSPCQESGSDEDCCSRPFNTKQTCKPTQYVQNFERDCPSAYTYAFCDNNSTFTCPNTTDYVITFCPSSVPNSSIPNITRTKKTNNRSSMVPSPEPKDNSQVKLKATLEGLAAVLVLIIIAVIAVVVRTKNARPTSVLNNENIEMRRNQSSRPMLSESMSGENPPMDGRVRPSNIQVFINFRGKELRNNFVGHLVEALRRNDINVFIDNHEQRGEDLTNLFKRIKESGIAIVVFSTRYTESKWCLDELVEIKECADKGRLKVLPIYYKVTPEDVKELKGNFGDHFRDQDHRYRSDNPKIEKWRNAILSVSQKFALTFDEKSNRLEIDFIELIVKEVLTILQASSPVERCQSSR